MTFNGRATYDNPTVIQPSVANLISIYSRTETPLLDYLGDSDRPATQPIHSWIEDALLFNIDTINDASGISNSDTTLVVANGARFNKYDLIMIEDEVILVTAVAGNSLTIVRGVGDSVAASHADALAVRIISTGNAEGEDVNTPKTRVRSLVTNWAHIIEPPPSKISIAEEKSAKYGGIQEVPHQMGRMMLEALRSLELAVSLSTQQDSTPAGADDVPRTMKGLRWWPTTNVVDAASAALSESYFAARLVDFYTNGAKGIDFCIAPAIQKRKIDQFKLTATRWIGSDDSMKVMVTEYVHSFSTKPLRIILSPWWPSDELFFGDSDNIKVVPFVPFLEKQLAEAGFYSFKAIHGEYTIEARHAAESTALVKNLSVTL
jgi:hypothetical protein